MSEIDLRVIGPDRFCPDCRRVLLTINPESDTFTLSGKTEMVSHGELVFDYEEGPPEEIEVVPEVFCLRALCRFKRWRRGEKIPRQPWEEEDEILASLRKTRYFAVALCVLASVALILQLAILIGRVT